MAHIPDYVVLLIDEKEVDKRNKLYKTIKAKAQIVEFHFPGEEAVYQFLKNTCKEKRLSSDEMTLRYFIQKMPQDMAYLLGEWEKLISYVQDGVITKEAINEICIFSLETRVFEMVKK